MSRKDYKLLAGALMAATPLARDGEAAMATWLHTVREVALALSKDNPRFSTTRFIAAATGESGEV